MNCSLVVKVLRNLAQPQSTDLTSNPSVREHAADENRERNVECGVHGSR